MQLLVFSLILLIIISIPIALVGSITARNIGEIVEALVKLISNPELRQVMGIKSREIIIRNFSSKTINSQILDLYQ